MPPTRRSSTGRVGFTAYFAAHVDRTLSVDERRAVREHYLNDVAKHTSRGLRRVVLMDPIGNIWFRFQPGRPARPAGDHRGHDPPAPSRPGGDAQHVNDAAGRGDRLEVMVEPEILNDPTDPGRFLRFGTDDGGMHEPHPLLG